MPTFRGFSTINRQKKFGVTDFELIKRDLLNAFLTREGQIPGRPDLGTAIWTFVFEPLVREVKQAIEDEVEKIIKADSRLILESLVLSSNQNTVVIEVAVFVQPKSKPETLVLQFNKDLETLNIS